MTIGNDLYSTQLYPPNSAARSELRSRASSAVATDEQHNQSHQRSQPESRRASAAEQSVSPETKSRAQDYLDAIRELKSTELSPKHASANKAFLDIAHYEHDVRLIDTYA